MRRRYSEGPIIQTTSAIEMIALQTRQRLALRAWTGITAIALILYGVVASLAGEPAAFAWGLTGMGFAVCAMALYLSRRSRPTDAGRLLLGGWLAALIWLGMHYGPVSVSVLAGVIPVLGAAGALSPITALIAGWFLAMGDLSLVALAAGHVGPLGAHAQQVANSDLVIAFPALMAATGTGGWLLARAWAQAIDQVTALAHSWEQGQQTLESRAIERSRKVQEANRQLARHAKQIDAAATIARLCSRRVAVQDLMSESARVLQTQLDLTHVLIYTPGPDGQGLVPKASHGAAGPHLAERLGELPLDNGSAAVRAFLSQEPILEAGAGREIESAANPFLPTAQSWAAFPLICAAGPRGVVELYSDRPSPFDGAVVAVMETIAAQLAFALTTGSQLFPSDSGSDMNVDLANRLEELSGADSFGDIGRTLLASVSDSPAVLARWLLIERDQGGVEWIVMRESWTDDEKPAEPVGTRLRLDDYPWAPFLSRTDPVVVEDIQTDRRANEAATIAARVAGVRSLVSIPLMSTAGWVGTWLVGRGEPSAFQPSLIRQQVALGRVAALTLDNLRLRSALRSQLQHERLRLAVAPPLSAPFDTGELLQHTVQSLGRILGVPRVAVHIGSGWEDKNGD